MVTFVIMENGLLMRFPVQIFFAMVLVLDFSRGSISPECEAWGNIKRTLKKEHASLSCFLYDDCTGLNCSGKVWDKEGEIGLQLQHCELPTSMSLFANIPELGIHTWKRIFSHNESFKFTDEIHGELYLRRQKNSIAVNLKLRFLPVIQKYLPPSFVAPMEYTVLKDILIPISPCDIGGTVIAVATTEPSNTTSNILHSSVIEDTENKFRNCSIYNSSCGPLEICKQLRESVDDGVCVCLSPYVRGDNGDCISSMKMTTTTELVPYNGQIPNAPSDSVSSKFLLEVTLLPICVVILTIVLIFMAVRFRLFQKLQNHFRARVYEHVLLGGHDDDDEPLTDPVA